MATKKLAEAERSISHEQLSKEFKEYSVAEFFKRNRQMLGYTGKVRSLTTVVHEYVTNSLDACEDAKILPEILVEIRSLPNGHYTVINEDNGTGIPKKNIGQALGMLLAGTKFARRQQKRGQQGIGAAYATLFSQITTGKTTHVKSSMGEGVVYECEVSVDINKNTPVITNEKESRGKFRGTRIELELADVEYNRSNYGVYEYLRRTALANPHCQLTLVEPNNEIIVFPRASNEIPKQPKSVLPHPLGITVSDLMEMAGSTQARKISSFLESEFSRISSDKVKELAALMSNTDFERAPKTLTWDEAEKITQSIQKLKWIAPDSDALVPIGEKQLEKSLKNLLAPESLKVVERPSKVFRGGISFMVEAAIAYGGKAGSGGGIVGLNAGAVSKPDENSGASEGKGELMRFANRVPLLFDAGSCAITEAVKTIDWSRYELKDWEKLPISIFVNFTSVYVPYTGAGKLAIAQEEEVIAEIRNALMECGRSVSQYIHGMQRAELQEERRAIFFRYVGEVAQALNEITGKEKSVIEAKLRKIAEERTSILEAADAEEEATELDKIEKAAEKELKDDRYED